MAMNNTIDLPPVYDEAFVSDYPRSHEITLLLQQKQSNWPSVIQTVKRRIKEKDAIFKHSTDCKSICLIGHSQIDQWSISNICGYSVRNCGIAGITSFEYNKRILKRNLLNCDSDLFLIMHGTNDIVWDYSIEEIVKSIEKTIYYIKDRNGTAPILYLACLHINKRYDRSNARIDMLNSMLKRSIANAVIWIDTSLMDDIYGNLNSKFTEDGLHLNSVGYNKLSAIIEQTIRGLCI